MKITKESQITENSLYPIVEGWLRRSYRCFATGKNTGLRYSRADVVGVRDVGGDLSGEVEAIIVEVKRGGTPFATASGQALGYRVYSNRVYLADYREKSFTHDEVQIASHLGIGLIHIKGKKCIEVLSSPYYRPMTKMNLSLMEKMNLGWCQFCQSMFAIGSKKSTYGNLSRENIKSALEKGKGVMFWNRALADRKNRLGIRHIEDGSTFERRFICPDCVEYLLKQVIIPATKKSKP